MTEQSAAQVSPPVPIATPLHAAQNWNLAILESQQWVKNIFVKLPATIYPVKMLRYWFMYHLIRDEHKRLGRPVRVCEIGVDRGQMLRFMRDAGFADIATWVAVDCKLQPELREANYSEQIEANVDLPEFALAEQYDVIIVLHLLEHLFEPEQLALRLTPALVPGGVMLGGFPATPQWLAPTWQNRIRRTAIKFGHVSVFSPTRVHNMATRCKMKVDFLSGAFLLRKSGLFLENFKGWLRFNLVFGALCPSLGGEIYWRIRK